jgi:hypothetical protein
MTNTVATNKVPRRAGKEMAWKRNNFQLPGVGRSWGSRERGIRDGAGMVEISGLDVPFIALRVYPVGLNCNWPSKLVEIKEKGDFFINRAGRGGFALARTEDLIRAIGGQPFHGQLRS